MFGDATYGMVRHFSFQEEDPERAFAIGSAILFILLGFFFKLSVVPGNLWAPEVYEGSPLPVAAFFMVPVKIAIFITLARLLNTAFPYFSHV